MADIGRLVGGGFGLIRERPLAVAVWGVLNVAADTAIGIARLRLLDTAPGAQAIPGQGADFDAQLFAIQTGFGLLAMLVTTIFWAAAFRSVLRPEARSGFALRLGADEMRLMAVTLILYLLFSVGGLFAALGFSFLVSLLQLVTGGNPGVAALFASLLVFALVAGVVFVLVRLSLVTPLVIARRRIGIDESWELTRGHFWSLLGAYILMTLIYVAALMLFAIPAGASMLALDQGAGGWVLAIDRVIAGDTPALDLTMVFGAALAVVMSALTVALWGGMLATATRALLPASDAAAESHW